ncbi:DUF4112 domain-containing protein [bacterium]|nr:DUF4112 domain-containing protein [bacterium]MCI0604742.1 DUF4112 domain-containing protein [bacterium]
MNTEQKTVEITKTRDQLDQLAWLLDNCFKIPGTKWRFGLEAVLGLVPGAGDIISGLLGLFLLIRAFQFRLPKIVIVRMLVNSLLDFAIGAIPFVGDAFDFVYKANTRNMKLFHQYAETPLKSTNRHWIFIGGLVAAFLGMAFAVLVVMIWAISRLFGGAQG